MTGGHDADRYPVLRHKLTVNRAPSFGDAESATHGCHGRTRRLPVAVVQVSTR
jgi:hypothetical protein